MNPLTDLETEKKLLGCIIIDNDIMVELICILKPEYFSKQSNQVIYKTMIELYLDKAPIDYLVLNNKLKGKSIDVLYIASLADEIFTSKPAKNYAKIVHDLYVKRQLIALNQEMMENIEDGKKSDELLSGLLDDIFDLSFTRHDNIKPVKEVVNKAVEQIERAYESKGVVGVHSGIEKIDEMTCGFKPKYYVVAGRPGTGKTALALNIATNADKKTLIFQLEMPDEEIGLRMIASNARLNTQMLENGKVKDDSWPRLTKACGELFDKNIFIDDSPNQTDVDIWTKAKRHKAKHGLDMVIIDYLQLMRSSKRINSRREELEEISRNIKRMTKDLLVPFIVLAQLSRKPEDEKRRPKKSDLREAGGIEQDADVIMLLHSPYSLDESQPKELVECVFAKHRGGPIGFTKLRFESEYTSFSDWTEYC